MSIPLLFLILLFGHVLGDFYFQSNNMANKKKTCKGWLIAHGLIYAACMALSLLALILFGGVAYSHNLLFIFLLTSLSHLLFDFLKILSIWGKLKISKWVFTIDQSAHLVFLFLAYVLWGRDIKIGCYIYDYSQHIAIVLGLLVIIRPVSLLIESGVILGFDIGTANEKQKNTSRMIGYLERIIVYFLLLSGEYSAIALVIATKSFARHPEIKNTKSSLKANYYIIGTFLSLTAVFAVTVILGVSIQ